MASSGAINRPGSHSRLKRLLLAALLIIFLIGYVRLMMDIRATGREIAEDPALWIYAGFPAGGWDPPPPANVKERNRWWRPPRLGNPKVEFGGITLNRTQQVATDLHVIGYGYDRHGQRIANPVISCTPSTLQPGQTGTYRGEFIPAGEVLWFKSQIVSDPSLGQRTGAETGTLQSLPQSRTDVE